MPYAQYLPVARACPDVRMFKFAAICRSFCSTFSRIVYLECALKPISRLYSALACRMAPSWISLSKVVRSIPCRIIAQASSSLMISIALTRPSSSSNRYSNTSDILGFQSLWVSGVRHRVSTANRDPVPSSYARAAQLSFFPTITFALVEEC